MTTFDPALMRFVREAAGMTAAELAEKAGLSLGQIIRFENGLRPSPESWDRIKRALRLGLEERVRAVEKARKRLAA